MKVLVIALDGLEYELVVKWRMRGLAQAHYGRHDVTVAVRPGEPLYTPFIWASFLLGRPSYEYGFELSKYYVERNVYGYPPLLRALYRLRVRLLGYRRLGLRRLLVRLGLFRVDRVAEVAERFERMPEELVEKTFVAEARRRGYRVWFHEFPSLWDPSFAKHRAGMIVEMVGRGFEERKRFLLESLEKAERDFSRALEMLRNNDLVLYYTSMPDEAHHLIYRPGNLQFMTLLRTIYGRLDNMVRRAARVYGEGAAVLVVSDHGYDPSTHEHSPYGFWSLNIEPPRRPRAITDFYNIILELLSMDWGEGGRS